MVTRPEKLIKILVKNHPDPPKTIRVSSVNFGAYELHPHDMIASPICLMIMLKNKSAGLLNDVEMVECREKSQ